MNDDMTMIEMPVLPDTEAKIRKAVPALRGEIISVAHTGKCTEVGVLDDSGNARFVTIIDFGRKLS